MWLGGDGIPMLCDVWRGFTVCALNFNEFPFFLLLCLGAKMKPFQNDIQMQYIYAFSCGCIKEKDMFMIMCMI